MRFRVGDKVKIINPKGRIRRSLVGAKGVIKEIRKISISIAGYSAPNISVYLPNRPCPTKGYTFHSNELKLLEPFKPKVIGSWK